MKTSRWFRFYDDALDHPKVQRLPADLFKFWVNLLCLASRNNGRIPPVEDVAFSLRVSEKVAGQNVDALIAAGLIDLDADDVPIPHNWDVRQFKSDVSTERVKRFRKRQETVSETPPDTEQIQRQKTHTAQSAASDGFEDAWNAYPKREGPNPKKPAALAFGRALKRGGTPEGILAAVKCLAQEHPSPTRFVPQMVTWLNQDRWETSATGPPAGGVFRFPTAEEVIAERMAERA